MPPAARAAGAEPRLRRGAKRQPVPGRRAAACAADVDAYIDICRHQVLILTESPRARAISRIYALCTARHMRAYAGRALRAAAAGGGKPPPATGSVREAAPAGLPEVLPELEVTPPRPFPSDSCLRSCAQAYVLAEGHRLLHDHQPQCALAIVIMAGPVSISTLQRDTQRSLGSGGLTSATVKVTPSAMKANNTE